LLSDLELNWPLGLLLHDDRASGNAIAMKNVAYPEFHEIAGAKLRVDGEVEKG